MNNTITVQPGQTLQGIYGNNWRQASGFTGDPSKLAVGTVLPAPQSNVIKVPQTPAPVQPVQNVSKPVLPTPVKPLQPNQPTQPDQTQQPDWMKASADTMAPKPIQPTAQTPQAVTPQQPVQATTTQATTQAIKNGANPSVLERARQYLGDKAYIGLCQAFVERATKGQEGIYASAIDAWNKQSNKAQTNMGNVQPGDAVYFAPDGSNAGYGHTGVYVGNNQFISATYGGIKQFDLNDWTRMTGQHLLGFIPSDPNAAVNTLTKMGQKVPDWVSQKADQASKMIEGFGKQFQNDQTQEQPDDLTTSLDAIFGFRPPIARLKPHQIGNAYSDMIRSIPQAATGGAVGGVL